MASHLALPALLAGTSVQCPDGSPPPCAAAPRGGVTAPAIDRNRIAILPFRVSSADSMLGEGVADLLATEFTGEGAPRAAHQGSVLRAWRRAGGGLREPLGQDQALQVARGLGAGQLIDGSLVGLGNRLTISASLMSVPGGTSRRVGPFTAPADSIESLVSRLAASLLAASGSQRAADTRSRLTDSPAAMTAYLTGLSLYRHGRYGQSIEAFARALEIDSLFASAAAQILLANGWLGLNPTGVNLDRVRALGWAGRDRVNARDRAILLSAIGPSYPRLTPVLDAIVARQNAVELVPDNPEAWYMLADIYFHFGHHVGIENSLERAGPLFLRALTLDSSFAGPLSHLTETAIAQGDTAAARRFYTMWAAGAPRGMFANRLHWQYLVFRNAPADRRAARAALDTMVTNMGVVIAGTVQGFQYDASYLDALVRGARLRSGSRAEDSVALDLWAMVLANAGQRTEAVRAADSIDRLGSSINVSILLGLYGDGDTAVAARWARTLAPLADGPEAAEGPERRRQLESACAVGLWHSARGDTASARRMVARMTTATVQRDGAWTEARSHLCAAVIAAYYDPVAVDRLDSIMRTGPQPTLRNHPFEHLPLARLLAARGDYQRALQAVRRTTPYGDGTLLAPSRRLEGELAARLGDRAGAERAWRHYLFLRANPDPALIPQRDSVRAALERLR